jgi:putative pyruvate formate lyase activating enzyme
MPGHESESQEIMKWMATNVSRDIFVIIMEQYHPDAHVSKPKQPASKQAKRDSEKVESEVRYGEINRHVTRDEISSVRSAAERCGLWRFVEGARHDCFNL